MNSTPDALSPCAPELPAATNEGDASDTQPLRKGIKSFVKRAGRLTTGQAKAIEDLGSQFMLQYQPALLDTTQVFGSAGPVILEIGFGMGEATAHIAQVRPDDHFVCCEVHDPGVGALLKRIDEQSIHNIRIFQHDAVEVLDNMIAPSSLAGVHIFFPDPWHKKRHNKRRLIQAPFIKKIAEKLQIGGYLHCATDWQPYAEQMLEVLGSNQNLQNTAETYAMKPGYRPTTKFETRGLKLGHGVWDLMFTRHC